MEGREHGIDSRDGRMTKRGEAGSVTRPHSVVGSTQMDILLGQRDTLHYSGGKNYNKATHIIIVLHVLPKKNLQNGETLCPPSDACFAVASFP